MTNALILAGHGSHISAETADVVWRCVDQLRTRGAADEITAAFWKEQPAFSQALATVTADEVTIVPLFTAQGFFTRQVIPAEMGLDGPVTQHDGRAIRYARTLSEHPHLAEVVRQRVEQALSSTGFDPSATAVTLIGHGTRRSKESREAVLHQAELLRATGIVAEVVATYLDDEPFIREVYHLTTQPNLIAVPVFLASGSHVTLDVPGDLGLPAGANQAQVQGREVFYTEPVGTDAHLLDVILELACEAGASLYPSSDSSTWDCFPAAGRDLLLQTVAQMGELTFGQLLLKPQQVIVANGDSAKQIVTDIPSLRQHVRENPFRPLATRRDLPGGWVVPISEPEMLHAVVETVYPGAVADWAANWRGTFRAKTFDAVITRQVGMFRPLADFQEQAAMVEKICGDCVRHATWFHGTTPPDGIPCAEPCNVWLSAAKEWPHG
ncbi:MAG: hypothetical protein K8L99_27170 [Anaerolineae bacterium]|nr:hypothetical protein [Anaerolineae bacterium]